MFAILEGFADVDPVTGWDVGAWVQNSMSVLFSSLASAGPFLFFIMAALAGVSLVITILKSLVR